MVWNYTMDSLATVGEGEDVDRQGGMNEGGQYQGEICTSADNKRQRPVGNSHATMPWMVYLSDSELTLPQWLHSQLCQRIMRAGDTILLQHMMLSLIHMAKL